jgi:hypothetical protein
LNWLLTVKADLPAERLRAVLQKLGAEIAPDAPAVPLDANEQTVAVEGPKDLPARAEAVPEIIGVYPSSELTLYGR